MGKHTKGPWKVTGMALNIEGGGQGMIAATRFLGGVPEKMEEHKANAVLMASAPDLLAACREARETLLELSSLAGDNDPQFNPGGRAHKAAGKLLRALNEAEGRK